MRCLVFFNPERWTLNLWTVNFYSTSECRILSWFSSTCITRSVVLTVISRQRVFTRLSASKTAWPAGVLMSQPKRSERTVSAQYKPDSNSSLLRSTTVAILYSYPGRAGTENWIFVDVASLCAFKWSCCRCITHTSSSKLYRTSSNFSFFQKGHGWTRITQILKKFSQPQSRSSNLFLIMEAQAYFPIVF